MLISISATREQAVDEYIWMEFDGTRGKEVSQRTHKRKITKGTVFGIKSLRSGSRFTVIFPDLVHINFALDKATGEYLIERSKKVKVPELEDRASRKTAGVKSSRRQELRRDFSNPRFSPKGVLPEAKNGINFENYQWRIVPEQMQVLHSKGREVFLKGELIGVRFERSSRGGVIVNRDGMLLRVDTDVYDTVVTETDLLPIQEWPNGFVDPESMKDYKRNRTQAARNAIQNTSEAMRLQRKADALEQELRQKQDREERKEVARAEQRKYDEIRAKIKSGEMQAPERELLPTLPEHISRDKTRMNERTLRQIEDDNEELIEDLIDFNARDPELVLTTDDDSTESPSEYDLENILAVRPLSAPVFEVEETFASIFNPKSEEEQDEEADNPFSLEGLDDGEDDDEDSDDDSDGGSESDSDSDGEDGETEDDESDDSESDDDPAEDDDGDGDPDDEDESPTDDISDGDEDADGTENEEDSEPGSTGDEESGEGSGGGSNSEDAGDADAGSDQDQKVDGLSDEEAAKVAKKYAAANSNLPGSSKEPEEGDVLIFNNDKKMKREFVILNVSSHKKSAKLVTYRLYNLTDAPDTINIVTVNKARGQTILDQASHVKDMKPGVFNRIYDMTEDMKISNEAIMS